MELLNESKENSFSELSERDKAFAVEYLTNGYKHADAAEAVGLSRRSGNDLLRRVGNFVEHLQSTSRNAALITKDFVEARYLELLPKLMGDESVAMIDVKTGREYEGKKFHSAETVSVLRDLSKAAGYIAEDGPKGGVVNVQINLGNLAGDEYGITAQSDVNSSKVTVDNDNNDE